MFPRSILLASVLALGLTTGCVPRAHLSWGVWAPTVPPTPLVEYVPPAPAATHLWVNGYWWWNGAQYVWVRGYWAPRPVDGYIWQQSGWAVVEGRYRFVPGRWTHPQQRARVRYVHPRPRVRVQPSGRYRAAPPPSRRRAAPRSRPGVQVR